MDCVARVGHVVFPPEVAADAEAPSVKRARRGNFDLNFFLIILTLIFACY